MNRLKFYIIVSIIFFLVNGNLYSQDRENELQSRTYLSLKFEPINNISLNITPELRFNDNCALDESLLETELAYKKLKFLELAGSYRFIINNREKKETEYLHRYAFSATIQKDFKNFEPEFRFSYTNYAEDDSKDEYFRYRALVKYDVPKNKLVPFIGVEAFHQFKESELYKMRYMAGTEIKLFSKNYLKLAYKFDYYQHDERNRHIIDIGYKIKF